ncbi:ATP-dependent Clp protease ATP-binding subunit [Thermogemmatispora sp.]|uniref:ATP-dependent Clp protease ATP-binding subunit n=1 Tax=Thermogemmatispora sp. TaxID=1968838 RepID=UPI001DD6776B|nr:ATP-dependent Clp protease ATP-binding subunit [Thermogemmatispora sp.]MBX5451758.1 ATP-dependent Clp protease ATP-binding subunit [Thermogemmatispora sp.]
MKEVYETYTPAARLALHYAREEASKRHRRLIGNEQLLLGILRLNDPLISQLLTSFMLRPALLRRIIEVLERQHKRASTSRYQTLSPATRAALRAATLHARRLGATSIGPEHLLLGLLSVQDRQDALLLGLLEGFGLTCSSVRARLQTLITSTPGPDQAVVAFPKASESGAQDSTMLDSVSNQVVSDLQAAYRERYERTPELNSVSHDLTLAALEGRLDPLIGREAELMRTMQILLRYTKHNPLLLGAAGTGKTAIVEGLAARIAAGAVPESLRGKRVVALDIGLLVAGTRYRGDLEERVQGVLAEIKEAGDILLFIDEIHMLIGAGGPASAPNVANLLKPLLARGHLQCIGATTFEEYARYFEHDAALARRFQPVLIAEPDAAETLAILQALRPHYEAFHRVVISDQALQAAIRLSGRYLAGRAQPDKAIDLIDEAAAALRMRQALPPMALRQLHEQIAYLRAQRELAIRQQRFPTALELRRQEQQLLRRTLAIESEWLTQKLLPLSDESALATPKRPLVNEEAVAAIVSQWTGLRVTFPGGEEARHLLSLEQLLRQRIAGQEEAISTVARAVRRARSNLRDPRRPAASFLFIGPSGVGKSHLAAVLAEVLTGDERALIRLDMAAFSERQQVQRLLGSPPGYQGYGESGLLSEALRQRPASIVLFEGIEKAHPFLHDLLLQVLEDGHLSDGQGHLLNFREAIIILTTGLPSSPEVVSVGFGASRPQSKQQQQEQQWQHQLLARLQHTFRPELLNRLDAIVAFHPLQQAHLGLILDQLLTASCQNLARLGLSLEISPSARDYLLSRGQDQLASAGARPLRQLVRGEIEDRLSEALLRGEIRRGDALRLVASHASTSLYLERIDQSGIQRHGSGPTTLTRTDSARDSAVQAWSEIPGPNAA